MCLYVYVFVVFVLFCFCVLILYWFCIVLMFMVDVIRVLFCWIFGSVLTNTLFIWYMYVFCIVFNNTI